MIRKKLLGSLEISARNLSQGDHIRHHTNFARTTHTVHIHDLPEQMVVIHGIESLWARFAAEEYSKIIELHRRLGKTTRIACYQTLKAPEGMFKTKNETNGFEREINELSFLQLARVVMNLKRASRVVNKK